MLVLQEMYCNDVLRFLHYTSVIGGSKNTTISVDRPNKNNMESFNLSFAMILYILSKSYN
jgi:hypothetical protein